MGGDGYALALRAGAPLIDMEFVQFFPIGHLGAAADRHGPDHVGSVPLQARRQAAQPRRRGVHRALRRQRGRPLRGDARPRHLRDRQGERGRPRLAARRRLSVVPALLGSGAARGVRPGDRPAGRERHRSHQDAGRGGADRALPHGRRRRRRAHGDRGAGAAGRRRGGRRRQWREPALRQRHHRGAGVRPQGRPHRGRARQRPRISSRSSRSRRAKRSICWRPGPTAATSTPPQ